MQENKIYSLFITIIVSVLPFVGRTADYGDFLFLAIIVALGAVIPCINAFRSKASFRLNLVDIAVLLFGIYVVVRDIQSSGITVERCLQYSMLTFLYLIVKLKTNNYLKTIIIGILLCGVIQSTIAYLQLLGFQNSNHSVFACTGSFSNPALMGCIVAVSLVIAVNEIKQKSGIIRYILICVIAYMLPILILSDSRASWVAFGASTMVIVLQNLQWKKSLKILIIGVVMIGVAIPLYNHKPVSADARVLIWKVCGDMAKEKPMTGLGSNAVKREYMHYQAEYFKNGGTDEERLTTANNNYAFNECVDVLCSYGAIGLLLFLSIVVTYFACNGMGNTPSAGMMCIFVFGMFSYPFSNITILTIFTLLLAVGMGKNIVCVQYEFSKYIIASIVIALSVVTGVKWKEFKRYDDAVKEYCWDKGEKEYAESHFEDMKHEPLLVGRYGTLLYETGEHRKAIPVLLEMSQLQASPEVYYDLGKCYEKIGEYAKAEFCYRRVSYMLPAYITPQYRLMRLYESTKQYDKATETAKYILTMPLKKVTEESIRMKRVAKQLIETL